MQKRMRKAQYKTYDTCIKGTNDSTWKDSKPHFEKKKIYVRWYTDKLFLLCIPVTWLKAKQGPYKMTDMNKIYYINTSRF
jgi:hypothetical protein